MIGAIIGDIAGSRFEFDRGGKTRNFTLFTRENTFTDDSVMTVAVAEALLNAGPDAGEKEIKDNLIRSMKFWGRKYPNAGYGARFIHWLFSDNVKPYGSFGNGSGMRVAAAGWLYDSMERTREVARWTAEVTHNHPEGIKGAESVAAAIYLARTGAAMGEIVEYIVKEFGYDLDRTLDDIRPYYSHVEDCMHTMPEAFTCFMEAASYEETLRNVMYIGGDTDTLCAIAGAVAEAFWGIPHDIMESAKDYIPEDFWNVYNRFIKTIYPELSSMEEEYEKNILISRAARRARESGDEEDMIMLMQTVVDRIMAEGTVPVIMEGALEEGMEEFMVEKLEDITGNNYTQVHIPPLSIAGINDTNDGNRYLPLFTDDSQIEGTAREELVMDLPIKTLLQDAFIREDIAGIVVNPFSSDYILTKEAIRIILKRSGV